MNTRSLSRVFSRVSLFSLVLASGLALTACGSAGASSSTDPTGSSQQPLTAPVAEPGAVGAKAEATAAEATAAAGATADRPSGREERGPGFALLRQVEGMDLSAEQQVLVGQIRTQLQTDLEANHASMRAMAELVASGIEAGKLSPEAVARQQALADGIVPKARAAFATAANALHAALNADQRAELVATMRAQHDQQKLAWQSGEHKAHERGEGRHGPFAKIADEIGLSAEQKQAIGDAVRKGFDRVMPGHKEARERHEAQMKAMGDAFQTEDFDATRFEFGSGAPGFVEGANKSATALAEVAANWLTEGQRAALAAKIRERAGKF